MSKTFPEILWAGTQLSLDAALEYNDMAAAVEARGQGVETQDAPALLSTRGNIGVVSIKGPLMNADSPILDFFGISTYPAIRRAIVAAALDPEISQIMLHVDSGGGAVSGCADTAALIAKINKVKPVTAYSDGTVCSAAYWLASAAGEVFVGSTTVAGSIGIMMVHMDHSKALAAEGVKPTILKAGKYKALGNPMEPLSEVAKAQIQNQLDATYKVFVQAVADSRGVGYAKADSEMAQGRVFLGQQAVDAGLADKVASFDGMLTNLSARKKVDKRVAVYDNGIIQGVHMTVKAGMTEAELAALAEGALLVVDANLSPEAKTLADAKVLADTAEVKRVADATEAKVLADAKVLVDAAEAKRVADAAAGAQTPTGDALVTFLQAQVKEKDAALIAQALELKAAKDKTTLMEATHDALLDVTRTSIARLRVALGGSAGDVKALGAVEALAEQKRLSADFTTKFKVGGVASVTPATTDTDKVAPAADAEHTARVKAVSFK